MIESLAEIGEKIGKALAILINIFNPELVVLGGMGHIPGVILGALLLTVTPEVLRAAVTPLQTAMFGRSVIDPENLRMVIFGLTLVLVMLFRPAGLWPDRRRQRELEESA